MKRIFVGVGELVLIALAVLITNAISTQIILIPRSVMEFTRGFYSFDEKLTIFAVYVVIGAVCLVLPKLLPREADLLSPRFAAREIFFAALSASLASLVIFLFTSIFFDPNHALMAMVLIFLFFVLAFFLSRFFVADGTGTSLRTIVADVGRLIGALFRVLFSVTGIAIVLVMLLPVATAIEFKRDKDFANKVNMVRALATSPSVDWHFEPYRGPFSIHQPIYVRFDAENPDRMYVLERSGRFLAFDKGSTQPEELLDFSAQVGEVAVEKGALGFDFHPDFHKTGADRKPYVYFFYTNTDGDGEQRNRLARFDFSLPTPEERLASELVMIELGRNNSGFHNAGMVGFGPDGFLYVSLGDANRLTNLQIIDHSLFAGILRLDVDSRGGDVSHPIARQPVDGRTQGYMIPNDNPFVDGENTLGEFWAIGLRNPFRFSFDTETDELWVGDVGAERVEEVDVVVRGGNYQYPYFEGLRKTEHEMPDPLIGIDSPPVFAYRHTAFERAIIGGFIYRGDKFPGLEGKYVFADNGSGTLYYLDTDSAGDVFKRELAKVDKFGYVGISSLQQSPEGDILITVMGSKAQPSGEILRLEEGGVPFLNQISAIWETPDAGGDNAGQGATGSGSGSGATISLADIEPVYVENCSRCHGADGRISSELEADMARIMPNFASSAWQSSRTDGFVAEIILKGGGEMGMSEMMPPWDGVLTEPEIEALVRYVRSLEEKKE